MSAVDNAIKLFWKELQDPKDAYVAPTEIVRKQIEAMRKLPEVLFAKPAGVGDVMHEFEKRVQDIVTSQDVSTGASNEEKEEERRLTDEVLIELAMQLNRVGLVYSDESIFSVLLKLCQIDETTVREKAIEALNDLCKRWTPEDPDLIARCVSTKVLEMFDYDDGSWTPGLVSACCLVAGCYQASVESEQHGDPKNLQAQFLKQLRSVNPMVQRTAAKHLKVTLNAWFSTSATARGSIDTTSILEVYPSLLADACQEHVIVNALSAASVIFQFDRVNFEKAMIIEPYLKTAESRSYKVRSALALSLPSVMEIAGGGDNGINLDRLYQTFYDLLVSDVEIEVKTNIAKQTPKVASIYASSRPDASIRLELADALSQLLRPAPNLAPSFPETVSWPIATALTEIAVELPPDECYSLLFADESGASSFQADSSLFNHLVCQNDANMQLGVRLEVMKRLVDLLNVASQARGADKDLKDKLGFWRRFIGLDPKNGGQKEYHKDMYQNLTWRLKHQAMLLLPAFGREGILEYQSKFFNNDKYDQDPFIEMSRYQVALIRLDWLDVCLNCAKIAGKDFLQCPLKAVLKPIEDKNADSQKDPEDARRALIPRAMAKWYDLLEAADLAKLRDGAVDILKDSKASANLRLEAVDAMGEILARDHTNYQPYHTECVELIKNTLLEFKNTLKSACEDTSSPVKAATAKELKFVCEEALTRGGNRSE